MNTSFKSSPKLSLCMIVKNERENLPRCLASVNPYVDEMIVVDTGSSDGTPEIALNYGAKVSYFEWCDDFAAARNYAISQASGEWILMLDADEELVVHSQAFLDEITSQSEVVAYLATYNEFNDQNNVTPAYRISLFRNLLEVKYIGRYHEYLVMGSPYRIPDNTAYTKSISILHYGFSKDQLLKKNISRNIPMLERIRQQEGLNLRLLQTLAAMYRNTQQLDKLQGCYAEALEMLLPNLIEGNKPEDFLAVPSFMVSLATEALNQNDYETARLLCQRGNEWCDNFPPLNYITGVTLRCLGFPLGSVAYFENCLRLGREKSYYKGEPFDVSYMTTYPAYDLGCIYMELKRYSEAVAAFEVTLKFDANFIAAQEKITEIESL